MKEMLVKMVAKELFSEKRKKEIVQALNDNIDVPFINEKTEGKYIEAMYETFETVCKKVLLK